jgi:hypothetical protein
MSKKSKTADERLGNERIVQLLRTASEPDEALLRSYFLECIGKEQELTTPLNDSQRRWVAVNVDGNPNWTRVWQRLEREFGRTVDCRFKVPLPESTFESKSVKGIRTFLQNSIIYFSDSRFRILRYALAPGILVILYLILRWFGQLNLPESNVWASIEAYQQNLEINMQTRRHTSVVQSGLAQGSQALLAARRSWLGLFPRYDRAQVNNAVTHLEPAFKAAKDEFQKAEIAFLVGKAYLMLDDKTTACKWFEKADSENVRDYYTDDINKLQIQLGCE